MDLSKINQTGFYFRKSNCEWTVPHEPDTFPDDFTYNDFDMETLEVSGAVPSETEGEYLELVITFTPEQIEAAKQTIYDNE
tara:strand:+ start:853 stop:1095 length:243 start_codon:yes stop_codon:yes gene_type:complete